jgi:hypothetical protein
MAAPAKVAKGEEQLFTMKQAMEGISDGKGGLRFDH